KLLICELKFANGEIHKSENDMNCIYLIDDITSELVSIHALTLFNYLKQLKSQVFITTTEKNKINEYIDTNSYILEI
ncbi:DNA replication and repair protein RecF, partial [Francisella tularensis subsp. holarctica]|nr:DNA replication and repair protein RecF [Francisella tularensis subsp. holarctica]